MSKKPSAGNGGPNPSGPAWPVYLYVAGLIVLLIGAIGLSVMGAALPGPDSEAKISLRNVQARRSHFFHYYAFGK